MPAPRTKYSSVTVEPVPSNKVSRLLPCANGFLLTFSAARVASGPGFGGGAVGAGSSGAGSAAGTEVSLDAGAGAGGGDSARANPVTLVTLSELANTADVRNLVSTAFP